MRGLWGGREKVAPPAGPASPRARRPPSGGSCARTRIPRHKVARQKSQPRQSCTSRPAPFFPAGGGSSFLPSPRFLRRWRRRSDRWRSTPRPPLLAYVAALRFATLAPGEAGLLRRLPGACAPGWLRAWPPHAARLRATPVRGGPGRASLSPCREALFHENRLPPADAAFFSFCRIFFARRLCRCKSLL